MKLGEPRLFYGPIFLKSYHKEVVEKISGNEDMKIKELFSSSSWEIKNKQEKTGVVNSADFHLSTDIRKDLPLGPYPVVEQMSLLQDHVGANFLFSLAKQDFFFF